MAFLLKNLAPTPALLKRRNSNRVNMMHKKFEKTWRLAGAILVLPIGLSYNSASAFEALGMEGNVSGYVREHVSVNLQDKKAPMNVEGDEIGGAGQVSMNRQSGLLNLNLKNDAIGFGLVGRYSNELKTPYLKKLESASLKTVVSETPTAAPIPVLRALGPICQGPSRNCSNSLNQSNLGGEFLDDYYQEGLVLREAYVDFLKVPGIFVRAGRQQVVWGETDFFRVTDIIHGYDQRWRSFFELENEELRKPSTLLNIVADIPKTTSTLQVIYKPGGVDRSSNYGNDLDLAGGRYAGTPTQGVNITEQIAPPNYHSTTGDIHDDEYGLRWSGDFSGVAYSLLYYRGLQQDPIANCRKTLSAGSKVQGVTVPLPVDINPACKPYNEVPQGNGLGGELLYPRISNYGGTFNYDATALDTVFRGEFLYTPNRPWNHGTSVPITIPVYLPSLPVAGTLPLGWGTIDVPGLAGVREKDTLVYMLGADKSVDLTSFLKTQRPSLMTLQVIDQWILNYKKSDQLVEVLSYGAPRDEHTTFVTSSLLLNYRYDTVNPSIAAGVNINGGDAFLIPAIDLAFGNAWRLHLEADLFFAQHSKDVFGISEQRTHVLGTAADNSQFLARLTYQF